jgi:hypothetical protein
MFLKNLSLASIGTTFNQIGMMSEQSLCTWILQQPSSSRCLKYDADSGASVSYDYGTDDKPSDSSKPPMFNGDPDTLSWWKTKMYSYIVKNYEIILKMGLMIWS